MNTEFQTLSNENAGAENEKMTSSSPSKGGERTSPSYLLFDKFEKVSHAESMTSPNPSKGGEQDRKMLLQNEVERKEFKKDRPGYVTADLYNYRHLKEIREELRENYTEAEKLLWKYLRNKKTGHRIRRQHIIDNFITDFVCLSAKVVIEIDGKIHLQQKEYDELRTNTLNEKGYKVIRFTNEEVLSNPEYVAIQIKETLDTRK
jgi:very-short-patch-repair endonuclease